MADLLKRLKISEQQYGVGMEDNPFQDVSNDEAMKVCFGGGGGSPPPPPPGLGNLSTPVKINPLDLKNIKLRKTETVKRKIVEVIDNRVPTKNQLLEQLSKYYRSYRFLSFVSNLQYS